MANCYKKWSPYAEHYNPIGIAYYSKQIVLLNEISNVTTIQYYLSEVGSKDGKDIEPHDNAIVRACNALYHPNHLLTNNPQTTLFIGRLDKNVTEKDLEDVSCIILQLHLVYDNSMTNHYTFSGVHQVWKIKKCNCCTRCCYWILQKIWFC